MEERVKQQLEDWGWEVRPGVVYGGLYLVAPKGSPEGHMHSHYIVHLASSLTYQHLLGLLRIAQSVHKSVLLVSEDSTGALLFHTITDI